jgi:putative copper resistance protein D
MELLIDLFGYLSIVLHGGSILAQSVMIGSVAFLLLLVRPLAAPLGPLAAPLGRTAARLGGWAAIGLVTAAVLTVGLRTAVLADTVRLSVTEALGAQSTLALLIKAGLAAVLAGLCFARAERLPAGIAIAVAALVLATATLTTHAAARLDGRTVLLPVTALHQSGAALWIGGIPAFLIGLARAADRPACLAIAERFSRISMLGVGCLLASALVMSVAYIGDPSGLYGTAYGVMVSAKIALFLMLLGLGGMNFLLVRRLRVDPATATSRLRRFAEAELGIGLAVFFAASSLTSVPPAIDLKTDRVTWAEIVERNTPGWPRLESPDHDALALPALQARLDAEAQADRRAPQAAFVPGAGDPPPRNANDIAWSEYNHHWAGLFVVAVGLLALLNQAGLRWARHWPLVFLGLAAFLFVRSDPEVWPLGAIGFWESLRDVEVLQHRFYVVLIVAFAWFEWRVRTAARPAPAAALVFPLLCATGGVLLLTHTHAIANVREQLLIEITHTPLALAGIMAGWARWLELRLDRVAHPTAARIAAWTWPVSILFAGVVLLVYREA